MQHTVVPVIVFLDGCHVEELVAARDLWLGLPERFRPDHDAWQQRLFRFDSWIDRVRRSRAEMKQTKAEIIVSDLLDAPIQAISPH